MASKPTFKIMSDIEHILIRTNNTGVFQRIRQCRALDDNFKLYETMEHSPCLLKCIDEPIVNTSDATLKNLKVTEIKVNVCLDSGIITIYNTGKGITHKIHKEGSVFLKRKIHTPEMIFTQLRSGSNLNIDKDHDVGGINGLGIKLTNYHSDWFKLETVYKKKLYKQVYNMDLDKKEINIEEPTIDDYDDISYTLVQFLPHYQRFEYTNPPNIKDMKEIVDIMRYRTYHLAIFLSFKKVKVYFNNQLIEAKDSHDLISIIEPSSSDSYPIIKTKLARGWFIEYAVNVRTGKFVTISTVNGIIVQDGTHITHLTRAINKKIVELNKDKDKKIDCKSYLCIAAIAWLPVTNWGNQSKDKLEIKEIDLKDYIFKDSILIKLAKDIIERSKIIDLKKTINKRISKKDIYDKYTAPKTKGNNTLFIAEGDSAMLLLKRGLAVGTSNYSTNNTGIFSLGGVPTNIAKNIKEEQNEEGEDISIASEKFYESKVFSALIRCLKIDPSKKYNTYEETKGLNYKKIVICVDADLDGIGNIASLVLQVFYRLWPNLFKYNFIHIWYSPILRITTISGKLLKEFKFEQEFNTWLNTHSSHDIKISYVKGLAGHDNKFIKKMFKNFDSDLVKMLIDVDTKKQFDIFFGKDSTFRKNVLGTPVDDFTQSEITQMTTDDRSLLCDRHLHKNTKEFQIYAMKRTIPGLDNLTPVRRKSFTSFYIHNQTNPLKIYMAAGRIAFEYLYHHGDASIQGAIIKMCQDYPGSNNYPLLIKDGQVGSRDRRGKDSGSARYVGASLNKKLVDVLFIKDDFPILPKNYTDGTEVEPKYYLPTLPLPILEFQKSVSYAWCLELYPRDLKAVCDLLIKMCKDKKITKKDKNIPLSKKGFKGELEIINIDNKEKIYMKGVYEKKSNNILHITELPLIITPKKVELALLEEENIVYNVHNHTTDDIDIVVELKQGWEEKVLKKYGSIDKFLHLETTMTEHINFIGENGYIEHFNSPYEVLLRCFALNKVKYGMKINRELLLLKYKILREKNIIKFINDDEIEKIKNKTDEFINNILDSDKFDRINSTILNSEQKYTTNELIEKLEKDKKFIYIMLIKVGDVSKSEWEKRENILEVLLKRQKELEEQLEELPFPGSIQYINNINAAYKILSTYELLS